MYIFAEKRRGNGTKPLLTPYQTKEQVDKPRITDPIKDQPKSRTIRAVLISQSVSVRFEIRRRKYTCSTATVARTLSEKLHRETAKDRFYRSPDGLFSSNPCKEQQLSLSLQRLLYQKGRVMMPIGSALLFCATYSGNNKQTLSPSLTSRCRISHTTPSLPKCLSLMEGKPLVRIPQNTTLPPEHH